METTEIKKNPTATDNNHYPKIMIRSKKQKPVLGIWKRVSINRNIRKKKNCLSAASFFLLGYEILIDRWKFQDLIFLFLFLSRKKEKVKQDLKITLSHIISNDIL